MAQLFFLIFYPKELREVIVDLREKNDLNKRALKGFYTVIILAVFWTICILLMLDDLLNGYGAGVLIIVLCLFFVLTRLSIRYTFYKYHLAYLSGQKVRGIIEKVYFKGIYSSKKYLKIRNCETNDLITMGPLLAWVKCPKRLLKGDVIHYYEMDSKGKAMPDEFEIKIKNCLSKSKIKEKRNEEK